MARKRFTPELVQEILKRNKDESKTITELVKEYGFYPTSFYNYLKRNNISTDVVVNKTKYNHNYFSVIDTEDKAYFLGLLFADGHIGKENRVSLKLASPDEYLVFKLRDLIAPDLAVSERNHMKWSTAYEVSFRSKFIHRDLFELGMVDLKTNEGRNFPHLQQQFMNHFIRGYFDGDGCITQSSNKTPEVKVYSPCQNFLKQMSLYLNKHLGLTTSFTQGNTNKSCVALNILTKEGKYIFLDYLYSNANYYMQRKYDKFISLFGGTQ